MTFSPFPVLQTERLLLRRIVKADNKTILFLRSDKTVNQFIERPENRKTKNITDALNFIKELDKNLQNNKSISWGITLKNNSNILGTICLWNFTENNKTAEVGYDLNPEFHHLGIMNEALKMVIGFGTKKLKITKIEAFTHGKNEPSKKLLEKNGFQLNKSRIDLDNASNLIYELKI